MTASQIADNVYIHPTAIIENNVEIGAGSKVWAFSHVCNGARIGEGVTIGEGVYIGVGVAIGSGCKIQNHAQIFQGVSIGVRTFIGPCVVTTNDREPDLSNPFKITPTKIGNDVVICANSTIICGNDIADGSFIGAGSVVTKPVNGKVYGNPAR